jgi:hypothetical protein
MGTTNRISFAYLCLLLGELCGSAFFHHKIARVRKGRKEEVIN